MPGSSTRRLPATCLLSLGVLFAASGGTAQPAKSTTPVLHHYDVAAREPAVARLPGDLLEASGLAFSPGRTLFCHNDERGVVYAIDPIRGTVGRKFSVGERTLRQDYEGIAVSDSLMFLVTSGGTIIEFREPAPDQRAAARTYRTELGSAWDVEGLCFDPATMALLLACKENPVSDGSRCVYAFSLRTHRLESAPRFVINGQDLKKRYGIKDFRPTSIERHPVSGSFFVLSSSDHAIIELSPTGKLLAAVRLDESVHRQPEGLTFGPDLTMYICNEGKSHGTLVRYPYRR